MGKIITIASQKGGVGKTTTALNFGYCLSRLGSRVLILDGDPQGGIAVSSNLRKKTDKGLFDVLRKRASLKDIIMTTREKHLSIVGMGDMEPEDVAMFEEEARKGTLKNQILLLADIADYTIIDAPAGVGSIVTSLLSVSDGAILTIRCTTLSLKTLPSFLKLIAWIRKNSNVSLRLDGILFTMTSLDNSEEAGTYEDIKGILPAEAFFRTTIPFDRIYEAASRKAVPVSLVRGGGGASRAYMDLALEYKEKELLREAGGEVDEDVEGLF